MMNRRTALYSALALPLALKVVNPETVPLHPPEVLPAPIQTDCCF